MTPKLIDEAIAEKITGGIEVFFNGLNKKRMAYWYRSACIASSYLELHKRLEVDLSRADDRHGWPPWCNREATAMFGV